jgi:hypothetical protein
MSRHLVAVAFAAIVGCDSPAAPTPVASVELSQSTLTIGPSQSGMLTAVARDASGRILVGREVSWTTEDATVATVSAGNVLAIGYGATTVIASVEGTTAEATVTVTATQAAHLAGWWRMHSFDDKTIPAAYWYEEDTPLGDGTFADVEIRLDSARMQMRDDGVYPYRQYCFSELHDAVVQFRYCWGDHGRFTLPQPGTLSLVSEYIQNLTTAGTVTTVGNLALVEQIVTQETPRATVWHRAP